MAQFDLPLDTLRTYRYAQSEPADFDAFWAETLREARKHPIDVRLAPVDNPLRTLTVRDVSFAGFGGERINGWLLTPSGTATDGPLPAVVEYIGYGGGRGLPHERLLWSSAGFAHLIVDTRGQGGVGSVGATADPHGSDSSAPGFLTRGIGSPYEHYYRRVFTDAVRAVEAVRTLPGVDASRIYLTGGSQGGGIALAAAALSEDVAGLAVRVPFLCAFRRSVAITDREPYAEVRRYLAVHRDQEARAFDTLGYFDGVFMAPRATCPAWFSVALMDNVCPPSSVFAAYNAYPGPKQIQVWPYNGHEGGGAHDALHIVEWCRELSGQHHA